MNLAQRPNGGRINWRLKRSGGRGIFHEGLIEKEIAAALKK